jgi:hypothetical protein
MVDAGTVAAFDPKHLIAHEPVPFPHPDGDAVVFSRA